MGSTEVTGDKGQKNKRLVFSWMLALGISVAILAMGIGLSGAPSYSMLSTSLWSFSSPWRSSPQRFTGIINDCECGYETVDTINKGIVYPTLQEIVKKPFFRYFKVKLFCDCPFWPDDGMCRLRDCSVCECPDDEFPEIFKGSTNNKLSFTDLQCQEGKPGGTVDKTVDVHVFRGWTEDDNPWTHDNESSSDEMAYVNLLRNPERYTGYVGESAHRIWNAIYKMNCFKEAGSDACTEKRVLYKLISGLHSSITTHIAAEYLINESEWGPNVTLLRERVLKFPDRVENLYFTFLFVLRAVNKAAVFLTQAEYDTGNPAEDSETRLAVKSFVTSQQLLEACPVPFDDARLCKGSDGTKPKQEIQDYFLKISALMDCVGCERCRLWGKLQVLGLGTALKLLVDDEASARPNLQRNEVIALLNLLARLSSSLRFVHQHMTTKF